MVMIEIDPERLDQVARSLSAGPEQVDQARRRALQATANRIRTRGAKQLGLRTGRFVGRRVKTGTSGDGGARIWFGLNPVLASGFITPAQARAQIRARSGVTVRGRRYPKGFFVRAGKRQRTSASGDKRDFLALTRRGSKIRPIRIDIENQMRPILAKLSAEIPELFEAEFVRQLDLGNLKSTGAQ